MTARSIWVVVPAFNEAEALREVIGRARSLGFNVVCVDDGSSDGTADVARRKGAHVVIHPANLGQGAAIQSLKKRLK